MTTIINRYIGITHPISNEGITDKEFKTILGAWKLANCSQGIHLFDEYWNVDKHVLHCDACGIEIYIEKIEIPDGKEEEI
jgi:hypothetical protein